MLLPELKIWLENNIIECNALKDHIGDEDIPYFQACLKLVNWHIDIISTVKRALDDYDLKAKEEYSMREIQPAPCVGNIPVEKIQAAVDSVKNKDFHGKSSYD